MKQKQSHPDQDETSTPPLKTDSTSANTPPDPTAVVSPAELDELRLKAQLADVNWDKYLRLAADFENYKKRAARERDETEIRQREKLVLKMLPMVDALESGLASMENQPPSVTEGVKMVCNMFAQMLTECAVDEIPAVGLPFDPILHHAVSQEHSDTLAQDVVIRQTRKGYRMGDRVLRAADVIVSSGAARKNS